MIDSNSINELRSINNPVPLVEHVLKALFLILKGKSLDWHEIKPLLNHPKEIIKSIKDFDVN